MKKSILTLTLLLVSVVALAVPAKRGVYKTISLTDGSEVRAELHGDEYAHFWASDEGKFYIEVAGSNCYEEVDIETIRAMRNERRQQENAVAQEEDAMAKSATKRKALSIGDDHDPFVGEKKGLIILVNFADSKFENAHDKSYYQRFANEENFTDAYGNTKSVKDYFLDQSYDTFALSFDIAGPVELEHNYAFYGYNNLSNRVYMVQEACDGAYNEGVDFSQYDWDADGEVEQVFIIYAGHGAADTGDTSYVWPHMSTISARNYDGTLVRTYACGCELAGDGAGNGIGTVCHEFSHCLGLPDAYDTEDTGCYGMSTWSLMADGSYNGGYGYIPAAYTAYERMYCGWLTPIELTDEVEVSGMKGLTEGGEAYVAYNKANKNEYYLFENRTAYGFDAALAGEGLLITHLDFNAFYWRQNVVNAKSAGNTHQRYTVIPADNNFTTSSAAIARDAWPDTNGTRLDNYTTPAAETYNANSDGSYYMNISVSNIRQATDGTISFKFYPSGTTPSSGTAPEGAVFYESFNNCAGTGGNDGDFGGEGVGTAIFYPDNNDWTCATAHGAMECAFFGSNTQAANVTTPTFAISGETTLSFRAAPYTALIPAVVTISCETTGISLSTTEISLPQGEWTDFAITLNGTGDVKLRLRETTGINRFFLDEVAAVPVVPESIESVAADAKTTQQGVYSLQGVYLGSDARSLPHGIYIVNGKKYIVR